MGTTKGVCTRLVYRRPQGPPLPFPDGAIRLVEPHCLNNVAKHRKVCTACKAPLPGGGFLCGYIRLIEPHRLSYVAKQPYKGRKKLPAGAHKIQFYAARFTTRFAQTNKTLLPRKTDFIDGLRPDGKTASILAARRVRGSDYCETEGFRFTEMI